MFCSLWSGLMECYAFWNVYKDGVLSLDVKAILRIWGTRKCEKCINAFKTVECFKLNYRLKCSDMFLEAIF